MIGNKIYSILFSILFYGYIFVESFTSTPSITSLFIHFFRRCAWFERKFNLLCEYLITICRLTDNKNGVQRRSQSTESYGAANCILYSLISQIVCSKHFLNFAKHPRASMSSSSTPNDRRLRMRTKTVPPT